MALQSSLIILCFLFSASLLGLCEVSEATINSFNSKSFPAGFLFGSSSSAYGYEGAAKEDGKGPSIWDTYANEHPERILDGTNGNIAADFYHRYKEDIQLMKNIGFNAFTLSISWSRILPYGKLSKGVNKKGIAFYNNLINALIAKGITPFVTLIHLDTPQALEDEYGGFLSPKIVADFGDYADLCFREFGDRVKYWLTFYEIWTFASMGYDTGVFAPGRCSPWMPTNCTHGNSAVEPYLVAHNMLLSHAYAVKLYRKNHKDHQKGQIGIQTFSDWVLPYNKKSTADARAAKRVVDFVFGWCLEPITYGHYPKIMRTLVGTRLPKFTKEQSTILKNSYDFIGVDYFSSIYAKDMPSTNTQFLSYSTDALANQTYVGPDGKLIGDATGISDVHVYPKGLYHLLIHTKKKYNNPIIYITDNGLPEAPIETDAQLINDTKRIDFHIQHLWEVKKAIKDGVRVKGYFANGFLDDLEYFWGNMVRFGLTYVDYKNGLKRIPKLSSHWFKNFLAH